MTVPLFVSTDEPYAFVVYRPLFAVLPFAVPGTAAAPAAAQPVAVGLVVAPAAVEPVAVVLAAHPQAQCVVAVHRHSQEPFHPLVLQDALG